MNFAEAYIEDLRAKRRAIRYPPFAATPAAQGCGRVHGEGPLTYAQWLYAQEYQHYLDTKLNPWKEATGAIDAQLRSLGVDLHPIRTIHPVQNVVRFTTT